MTSFTVPRERLERRFVEKNPRMTETQALAEASRCLYCYDAPCIKACPTGINIPEFIRKIATANTRSAAKTILSANILGYSCARVCPVEVLCEGDCVYNNMGRKPIEIGRLQRYATEDAYERGLQFFEAGQPNGRKVALVGAGPASLACAHELTRLGYTCVCYEAAAYPGGLNTDGVAPYKLFVEDAMREVQWVKAIGFEVRYGMRVGEQVTFAQLEAEYDAIFLGVGLGGDGWMGLPGENLPGVVGALQLIEAIKLEPHAGLETVRSAAVVGAGNTAMDVVQELLGLGVPEVTLVYRRGESDMSGYEHEWAAAKKQGARALWWAQPLGYEGDERVRGLRWARTRLADAADPRSRVLTSDEQSILSVDLVAVAIGQEKLVELIRGIGGVAMEHGRLVIDSATGQTANPKYFAGGDAANGGKEVVNAAAEGKRAAHGIHRYLNPEA